MLSGVPSAASAGSLVPLQKIGIGTTLNRCSQGSLAEKSYLNSRTIVQFNVFVSTKIKTKNTIVIRNGACHGFVEVVSASSVVGYVLRSG